MTEYVAPADTPAGQKTMRSTRSLVLVLVLSVGLLGLFADCGARKSKGERQSSSSGLTEGQRDSAIAASRLPGANAVGRAMAIADSAEAAAKRTDDQP